MNRRQASMLVAAALSTLFGCGWVSRAFELKSSETRKNKEGVLITKRVFTTGPPEYQRADEPAVSISSSQQQYDSLARDFDAAESATGGSRSAAAVEREKLVPTAPAQQSPAPGGITSPLTGPKIDLPTQQIYQPPGTPPGYQPPSGYHH